MEVLLNEWLPIWKPCRKTNYVNLTMTNMDILYNEMDPYDLKVTRINGLIRHTKYDGMMEIDEYCEILNDYLTKRSLYIYLEKLDNTSLFISLMPRCTYNMDPNNMNTSSGENSKDNMLIRQGGWS